MVFFEAPAHIKQVQLLVAMLKRLSNMLQLLGSTTSTMAP